MTTPQVVRFGTFELDRSTGELRSQGKRVALQDQPAQVLSLLVSRPGEVVTRDEMCRALWSEDTFVDFDTALNVAVNKVRQALRDSATSPRFIETIPRRGYRFLSDVHPVADTPAAPPVSHRPRLRWAIGIALGLLLAAVAIRVGERFVRPSASPQSVAVLPFKPLIAGSRDEALEMGLAESVIVKLGQRQGLRVPSIGAVRRYAGPAPNPRQAGRELGVDTVLDGSLLRADGRLRVSARLLDVDTGTTRWAEQWNIPWTDVFMVEDAMATEVTRVLAPALGPGERVPDPKPPTNAAAYDRYLRGRYLVTSGLGRTANGRPSCWRKRWRSIRTPRPPMPCWPTPTWLSPGSVGRWSRSRSAHDRRRCARWSSIPTRRQPTRRWASCSPSSTGTPRAASGS